MKGRVYAIAAAIALTSAGVQGAHVAQAAARPVYVSRINSETAGQWKETLQRLNVRCDLLFELLSRFECDKLPEKPGGSKPEQPEVPGEGRPEQPGTPEEKPEEKPDKPGDSKPDNPGESKPDKPGDSKPDNPGESKPDNPGDSKPDNPGESKPEEQDKAYVYGLRITELVNQHRAEAGLAPVEYSAELSKPAQTRVFEIEKSFSHTRPDGRYFSSALKDHGISYRYTGENIAWGHKSPEEVVEAWMNSPGHRANILNERFTKLGVGYQQNAKGVNYFTQLFTN
mgnify:CR=1 FL=1